MCGIVGAIAEREVREILLEGLKRLEYRGYDSAGLAFISPTPNALATQINTIKSSRITKCSFWKSFGRDHGNSTHQMGNARSAGRKKCSSASLKQRSLHRTQRDHREPQRDQNHTKGIGLSL